MLQSNNISVMVQPKAMCFPFIINAGVTYSCPSEAKNAVSSLIVVGLNLILKPLYGDVVQCVDGDGNYLIPYNSAAGSIVHFKGDEGLNSLTAANDNANTKDKFEDQLLLLEKSLIPTCSPTGSSATAINMAKCKKNLHVVVLTAEASMEEEDNIEQTDHFKHYGKSSLLMEQIKSTILQVCGS